MDRGYVSKGVRKKHDGETYQKAFKDIKESKLISIDDYRSENFQNNSILLIFGAGIEKWYKP